MKRVNSMRGFTLIETLASLLISSVILCAAASTFSTLTKISRDNQLRTVADLQAQSVLELMVPDFRMIGNGVPFHQANFLIGDVTMSDPTVAQPILASGTTSHQIKFRLNESGETYILTTDFNPAIDSSVTLTSTANIFSGDQIYITNSVVGDDDGLWATVSSVNVAASTVTFASGMQYHPGATFVKGSLLEVTPLITYSSTTPFGGITRDDGTGTQILADNAEFTITFYNASGNVITLPLLASTEPFPSSAIQNVRSVKIDVSVRSSAALSTGALYTASSSQYVSIRNLNFKY